MKRPRTDFGQAMVGWVSLLGLAGLAGVAGFALIAPHV